MGSIVSAQVMVHTPMLSGRAGEAPPEHEA